MPEVGAGVRRLGPSLELQRGTSLGHGPAGNSQASGELVDSKGVGRELEEEVLSLHP